MFDFMIILLALGLSMDAFAVSIVNGMCRRGISPLKNAFACGLAFGTAQGVMPLIGYLLGHSFSDMVDSAAHWIALVLLGFIGGKMIYDSKKNREEPKIGDEISVFSLRTLALQAIATSIDALAVGVSLGALRVNLAAAVSSIAGITFVCCFAGVFLGRKFGRLFKDKAGFFGGIILVAIGIRIFVGGII